MSEKRMSDAAQLDLVHRTLDVRDPGRQTIVVGTAAIIAELHEAGIESPLGCEDVDVLCSSDFFDNLLRSGPFMEGISKFQVRWPKGRLLERGATNKSVDIYPLNHNDMAFTASTSMSDLWYPINYESCRADIVESSGIRCLRIGKILEWLTAVGREKDIRCIESVLPIAVEAELVAGDEEGTIKTALERTREMRREYPERYFAWFELDSSQ